MALFASGILPPTYCAILHSSFRGIFQLILPSTKLFIQWYSYFHLKLNLTLSTGPPELCCKWPTCPIFLEMY